VLTRSTSAALQRGPLPYLAGYGFPLSFDGQPSLLGSSSPAAAFCRRCRWPT